MKRSHVNSSALGHPLLLLARRIERLEALDLPNTLCAKVDVSDEQSFIDAIAKLKRNMAQSMA